VIRRRLGQWVGTVVVVALAGAVFWMAVASCASPAALAEAMSKAARQRLLTP